MKIFPKVIVVDELPQWIISSDIAAYHPATQTIWLRSDRGLMPILHEFGHHIIHLCGGKEGAHNLYDGIWDLVAEIT